MGDVTAMFGFDEIETLDVPKIEKNDIGKWAVLGPPIIAQRWTVKGMNAPAWVDVRKEGWEGELEKVDVRFVVLFGEGAVKKWRGDLGREMDGRFGIWGEKIVLCLFTPVISNRLIPWKGVVKGIIPASWCLGTRCVRCDGEMDHYDSHGVAWCEMHWRTRERNARERLKRSKF